MLQPRKSDSDLSTSEPSNISPPEVVNTSVPGKFHTSVPGKWILAGEHSVLRGGEALVFPLTQRYLELSYTNTDQPFALKISGAYTADLELIIWSVFEKALIEVQRRREDLHGELQICSHIEFGAGMGASATLAVGLARFFQFLGFLKSEELFSFAKKIEDLFHGESSGVDVAVALYQKPLLYKKGHDIQVLDEVSLPRLYLSHCGVRGVTKDCVSKVKKLFETDSAWAEKIDERMKSVVTVLKQNLNTADLAVWTQCLTQAQSCFVDWGLVPAEAQDHILKLRRAGALACKMTGSGGGGYVLSLWNEPPLLQKTENMIAITG